MSARRTTVVSVVAVGAVLLAGGLFALPALSDQPGGPTPPEQTPVDADGTAVSPENDSLVLETRTNETITGTTDRAAGTNLTVRITSENATNPFLYQYEATVRENGTFAAAVDLSGVGGNATATVSVHHDGAELTNRTAAVRHVAAVSDADDADEPAAGTRFDYDGDVLTVRNATDRTISGTTDRAAGTDLTVRARSGSGTPFLRQRTATVRENGTFAVTMDFESVPAGTEFTVSAHHDDETLAEADARIE